MTLNELIEKLNQIKEIHGGDAKVVGLARIHDDEEYPKESFFVTNCDVYYPEYSEINNSVEIEIEGDYFD